MKTVTPGKYIEGVRSIYDEQPVYELGHDGTGKKCDCIGMVRGGLQRAGATDVKGLNGTNYAARHTIQELKKITSSAELKAGDVVLKTRDKDDKSMPLPVQYRKNGSDYSQKWGETNFSHIGTVIRNNPLRIMHMTSPTAKIDTGLGKWEYAGKLPWVDENAEEETPAEWVYVTAEKGSTVKMRAKPSTGCRTYWDVPVGSQVVLIEYGEEWSGIIWAGRSGYMMTKFLTAEKHTEKKYTVTISGLDRKTAKELITIYGGEITAG